MNNHFTILSLLLSSTIIVNGCSNDSPFTDPNALGTNEIAPAGDVITQIADQNSFSISREKTAVEGLNYEGNTSEVTVRAADRHNNPVPDNTAIKFLTNGGRIEPQCLTTDGECTVTWTEQLPTPANFKAIILAYTTGEESFTDLNDNDNFDAGETFTDISEPFFDLNEDGLRDANTEEFVDANNDNVFDTADGLFTGAPCIGDNTVCNRVTTLIWNTTDILLSGSFATISMTGALPTTIDSSSTVTISVVDTQNGNPMADGTTVEISSNEGAVDPSTWTFAPRKTEFDVVYTTGGTAGISETLKIIVTSPSGDTTTKLFVTNL